MAILSTGDELVPIGSTPGPSQIRNSSSAMLAAMVSAAGGDPWVLPIARDTAKSLDAALARAAAADLLLITGGVSAGKFDLVEPALAPRRSTLSLHRRPHPARQASGLWRDCHAVPQIPSKTKTARSACVLRAARQSRLFRRHVSALRRAGSGRSCRESRLGPRFALARLAEDVKTKTGLTRFLPAACTFAGPMP